MWQLYAISRRHHAYIIKWLFQVFLDRDKEISTDGSVCVSNCNTPVYRLTCR